MADVLHVHEFVNHDNVSHPTRQDDENVNQNKTTFDV